MLSIFLPNTPAQFIGKPEVYEIIKVKMTCGGGMGGCSWNEYIRSHSFPINPKGMIRVINYKGEEIMLNADYMVKASRCQIVTIDISSQNPHYGGFKRYYYESPVCRDIALVNKFGDTTKQRGVELVDTIEINGFN